MSSDTFKRPDAARLAELLRLAESGALKPSDAIQLTSEVRTLVIERDALANQLRHSSSEIDALHAELRAEMDANSTLVHERDALRVELRDAVICDAEIRRRLASIETTQAALRAELERMQAEDAERSG
jgi:hypothetical protein